MGILVRNKLIRMCRVSRALCFLVLYLFLGFIGNTIAFAQDSSSAQRRYERRMVKYGVVRRDPQEIIMDAYGVVAPTEVQMDSEEKNA